MGTRTWNRDRAMKRIDRKLAALPISDIEIKECVRDTNLENLPARVAYRLDGVHVYVDILNLADMLRVTAVEGETCHKRTLRFLNLHYRAVHRILARVDAIHVDFQNQRLHAVVAKPYDSEAARVCKAIAVAQLIIDVLGRTGEDADHPAAKVRVGIDTGKALAVNNGRRGHREPLFLGPPANYAAKRACGGNAAGICLTNTARTVVGLRAAAIEDSCLLSAEEIRGAQEHARLGLSADEIVVEWRDDLEAHPIGSFEFSGHTPPFSTLDLELLSGRNSRRQDACSIYADLDGFTDYVGRNIATDGSAKHVVRALHVLRSELDAVLHEEFAGRKIRFIGDCVHGISVEGTAQTTDAQETITNALLCAAAMRSSFKLGLDRLLAHGTDARTLGLAIGFEYGPLAVTRLGVKADLIRCAVSRGVLASEAEQSRCGGTETAIGQVAYAAATDGVRSLFGSSRKREGLEFDAVVAELAGRNDKAAKAAKIAASTLLMPATAAATPYSFPDRPTGPAKPDGFA